MFTKKKHLEKKLTPPSGVTHIHYHNPSVAAEIGIKVVAAIIVVMLTWPVGVFLFKQAGFKQPEQTLAQLIVFSLLFGVGISFLNFTISSKWEQWLTHKEAMAEKYIEQIRYQHLLQQTAVANSRQLGERARLVQLVIAVLFTAYDEYAKNGSFTGIERPWSRRKAAQLTLAGETEPVGETMGGKVRPFLESNQLITNNQLNLDKFPNLASVQQYLQGPVIVDAQLPIETANWSIIDT